MAELCEHADPDAPGEPNGRSEHPPRLDDVLACLRGCAAACEPPVGIGSFDVLYASSREVVVWYSPARPEHRSGEVSIPTARLAAAWGALTSGEALDEAALERIGEGVAGGRWLLAVLAQLPGVRLREEPLALEWAPPEPARNDAAPAMVDAEAPSRRRRKRAN
jgi:hypothetical protein